jgi:class 3 adenylate cyclase
MTKERTDVGAEPDGDPGPDQRAGTTGFRAFLLSDIRGYTSFAAARGDEAAAALTGRFIGVAERVLGRFGGESLGNRGDEVLFAFESPRQAIRAAVAFEQALLDATREDPSLPMPAGVGIDVGEAVRVPDGWRANAINLAARLCSIAKGGEILATKEVTHLAQAIDGIRYLPQPPARLKGIPETVAAMRIVADVGDPARGFAELGLTRSAAPPDHRPSRRGTAIAAVTLLLVAGAAVATLVVVSSGGGPRPTAGAVRSQNLKHEVTRLNAIVQQFIAGKRLSQQHQYAAAAQNRRQVLRLLTAFQAPPQLRDSAGTLREMATYSLSYNLLAARGETASAAYPNGAHNALRPQFVSEFNPYAERYLHRTYAVNEL